jgi:hypothetical protein
LVIAAADAGIVCVQLASGGQRGFLPEAGKMKNTEGTGGAGTDERNDLTHDWIWVGVW